MILFSTQDDERKIEIEVEEIKKIIMVGRKRGVERDDRRENRRMKIRGNIETKETKKKKKEPCLFTIICPMLHHSPWSRVTIK